MAELEILSMYVLTPMLVEYNELNAEGQPERHEKILMIDPVDDRVFWPTGELVKGPLYAAIMEIVRKQKNPVKFLTEEQITELIKKKSEEETHARKIKP
jgi:hypothetical protein